MRSILLAIGLAATMSPVFGQQAASLPEDTIAVLLVIDHSGSMKTRDPGSSVTRWEKMRAEAIEIVRKLPLESHLWIAVFSHEKVTPIEPPFRTEADRERLIQQLQGYPGPDGGTHLYDTLHMAFEEAQRLSQKSPNRHVAIYVYTDGKDEGSTRFRTLQDVEAVVPGLKKLNRNSWLVWTGIGPNAAIKPNGFDSAKDGIPLPIQVDPPALVLQNPAVTPTQEMKVDIRCSDAVGRLLQGKLATLNFRPADNTGVKVRVESLEIKPGKQTVGLQILNAKDLDATRQYTGTIEIRYPSIPQYRVDGRKQIAVTFPQIDRLTLGNLSPLPNATFPVGTEIQFLVETEQDAKVFWRLGDGITRDKASFTFKFQTPGKRNIKLSVSGRPGVKPEEREIPIEIVDAGLSVDPFSVEAFADDNYELSASIRGDVERLSWVIDGSSYDAQLPVDGKTKLALPFDVGAHKVLIKGYLRGLSTGAAEQAVYSETRILDVIPSPRVRIQSPQQNDRLEIGRSHSMRARVEGPVDSVVWQVVSKEDPQVVLTNPVSRPVLSANGNSFSDFNWKADSDRAMDVTIRAVGSLKDGLTGTAPESLINASIGFPSFAGSITGGDTTHFDDQPVQLSIRTTQEYESVRWRFGGKPSGSAESTSRAPVARWPHTGSFPISAVVTDKEGRETKLTTTVKISSDKPTAAMSVLSGGEPIEYSFAGSPLELSNSESTGTILRREWKIDGEVISGDITTYTFDKTGGHEIELLIYGPPQAEADGTIIGRPVEAASLKLNVYKPVAYLWMILYWLLVLVAAVVLGRLITGNAPRSWILNHADDGMPEEDASRFVRVKRYWNWWKKEAQIPASIVSDNEYFDDNGHREYVKVSGELGGSISYSGASRDELDGRVRTLNVGEPTERTVEAAWKDNRAKPAAKMYFLLSRGSATDFSLLLGFLVAAAAIAAMTWLWFDFHTLTF